MEKCIGFNKNKEKCKFGFDQSGVCRGFLIGYQGDYNNKANIPQCCSEDTCGRLYWQTGGKPNDNIHLRLGK